jgi:hypothetical protein
MAEIQNANSPHTLARVVQFVCGAGAATIVSGVLQSRFGHANANAVAGALLGAVAAAFVFPSRERDERIVMAIAAAAVLGFFGRLGGLVGVL